MARKKFFYNRVYNAKKNIINIIIIGVSVIGIILCFIITSHFQGKNPNQVDKHLNIKEEVTIEANDTFSKEIFFSKIENVNLDDIIVTYPDNYNVNTPGRYNVIITINEKNYNTTLVIIDTTKPILALKELTINENESYNANDFVTNCTDNSVENCNINFYTDGTDQDGNKINYSDYKTAGTYPIKIIARDSSGNQTIEETKLTIKSNNKKDPAEQPETCKYGNTEYDTVNYLLAVDVSTNKCAISLDSYKDTSKTEVINALMKSETLRIKKDIDALNIPGTLTLNRKITAIVNTSGDGIVGYELKMTVVLTYGNDSEVIADYKIDRKGKRIFTINKYNLSN